MGLQVKRSSDRYWRVVCNLSAGDERQAHPTSTQLRKKDMSRLGVYGNKRIISQEYILISKNKFYDDPHNTFSCPNSTRVV